jgi:hypothetical protein
VRGVGHETPLRREREVEPGEHRVERVREPLQLVVRPVELDPPRQLPCLDLARDARDVRDRGEHPPGDHPADEQAGDEERPERRQRERAQIAERPLVHLVLERLRVDERALLRAAAVVDGHLLDDDRLRDRLVPEAEREAEVEARHEHRGDEEEDARVEQRQPHPDRAQERPHASSRNR